jgi:tetratricopeptide (TPR) repeat protein
MQYIIITLLSIVISTFLIYLLTNRLLNIHLKIKPLVLCACCALLINIVLPRIIIGFASIAATLSILAIFIFAFAYSIAYYNDRFSKTKKNRDLLNQTSLGVQVSTNQQDSITIGNHNISINDFIAEDGEAFKGVSLFKELEFEKKLKIAAITELSATVEMTGTDTVEKIDVSEKEDKEQILSKENEITANLDSKSDIEGVISSLEFKLVTSPIIFDEVGKRETVINGELQDQSSDVEENNESVPTEHEKQLPIIMFSPTSNDLDSLMDIAFMHKEQRNYTQALTSFHQALTLYPNSEAAPFLVMEIGNILKNNGQYNEAISVFCEARKLPGLQQNKMFEPEFIKTIAYLRIVKNMLLQHHLGFIPFNCIPDHVLKDIDVEFREWRNPM